jgi:hypothetical protein
MVPFVYVQSSEEMFVYMVIEYPFTVTMYLCTHFVLFSLKFNSIQIRGISRPFVHGNKIWPYRSALNCFLRKIILALQCSDWLWLCAWYVFFFWQRANGLLLKIWHECFLFIMVYKLLSKKIKQWNPLDQHIVVLTCIWEVSILNLNRNTDCSHQNILFFSVSVLESST